MSGIILGPGLIGEEASLKAQRTAVDDAGGGAIQLGPGLVSKKKFGRARDAEPVAQAVTAVAAPVAPAVAPVAAVAPGLSEDDVEVMLAADANSWDIVAEAEAKRAEGWRPRVAQMLLLAASEAKAKPMDSAIIEHLKRIAQVGVEADAAKLAATVGAAQVGTGDPDASASSEPSASKSTRRPAR
jgi:hypothetical protein